MNISTQFAPPFKLIAPFFILGLFSFIASTLLLLGFDIQTIHYLSPSVLAWVHIFLLGFVMMVIFGAMAQLVPVVLEVGHFAVDLYYAIYPLLFFGVLLMASGFYAYPILLPFGGLIAFIAFAIFLFETFLTILKVKNFNFVIVSIIIANTFLLIGLIFGIVLALGYAGIIDVDSYNFLKAHIYLVFIGYVSVTIMGMSLILLPMFWLSHNFSWKYVKMALGILCLGIACVVSSCFTHSAILEYSGYALSIIALFLYFVQVFVIYKKRVRLEKDVYFASMIFSYVCLILSLILGVLYFMVPLINILFTMAWFMFAGFITFIITGHLYKIVPFLVWFERFSPHVGKKQVPMLADMISTKSSMFQFFMLSIGVIIAAFGLLSISDVVFKSGVSLLIVGALFLFKDIVQIIMIKEENYV